jgi:ribosomal protein S18 acetylase RimI-like enzyme
VIIRAAHETDASAMGQVMVATYLSAHRGHVPAEAWEKRAREWTPEVSAQAWARTLHEIATGSGVHECVYVADDDGAIVGLAMGGPAEADNVPQTAEVYALYVSEQYQGKGVGRRLVQAVAADLARQGIAALHICCLAANAPARRFYEAIGGRIISERLVDEEGFLLPAVVYGWDDISVLGARDSIV